MARTDDRRWPWPNRDERREVAEVLDRLGIGALGKRHIRKLPGAQQQRVFIARALLGRPDVLFLDEPTSGVDVKTRHEVLHLLAELHADGLAIVLNTHDLNGIATHLPRLLCVNVTVAGIGDPRDVLTPEILELVYGAPMDVLEHAGMPLVVDRARRRRHRHAPEGLMHVLLEPFHFAFLRHALIVCTFAGARCGPKRPVAADMTL